jgi:hypothetical protein
MGQHPAISATRSQQIASQALDDGNGFLQVEPRTRRPKVSARTPFLGIDKTLPVKILSTSNEPALSPAPRFGNNLNSARADRGS